MNPKLGPLRRLSRLGRTRWLRGVVLVLLVSLPAPARAGEEIALPPLDFGVIEPSGLGQVRSCLPVDPARVKWPARTTPVGGARVELTGGIGIEVTETRPGQPFDVCVVVPRCCAEGLSMTGGTLRIEFLQSAPAAPASLAFSVPLAARVPKMSWFACHAAFLAAAAGLALLAVLIAGWIWPRRFAANDRVKLAGSERGLHGASARQLRSQPGGRGGFYRHATACFDAKGSALRAPRRALLVFRAGKHGRVELTARAQLECQDARTKKWELIRPAELPRALVPGRAFRAGDLYFSLG
jgi:hypothetical protein